jgi:hypothetical protein
MCAASAGVTRRASTPRPPPPSRTLTRRPEPKRLSAGKGEAFRAHQVHRSIMFMSTNGLHYMGSITWAPVYGLHYAPRACLYDRKHEHACTSMLVRERSYDSLASSLWSAPAAALVHGTMGVEGNGRRGVWA